MSDSHNAVSFRDAIATYNSLLLQKYIRRVFDLKCCHVAYLFANDIGNSDNFHYESLIYKLHALVNIRKIFSLFFRSVILRLIR